MIEMFEMILGSFRDCFKKERTFQWFVLLILGFMIRSDHIGLTSVIRDLALLGSNYESMLHFFYSSAWALENIRERWYQIVKKSGAVHMINDRAILVGDGTKHAKEAFYMPGVKKLAQESENSSKPEYIHGHMFGAVGVLVGAEDQQRCLPLSINIQDGLQPTANWDGGDHTLQYSHVIQMIQRAFRCASALGNSYLLLDRYFLSVPALTFLRNLNTLHSKECNLVEIITKAKSNCIAYKDPLPRSVKKAGRPRIKGESVKLKSLFNDPSLFTKTSANIYGTIREVEYHCVDLLWGQRLYQKLRFVLTICGDKQSILVSTDLTLSPVRIIELYAKRFKIESFFRVFKQEIGGFSYHFWNKFLTKLNHFQKKTDPSPLEQVKDEKTKKHILKKIRAIEMFVQIAVIATGVTQLCALKDDGSIRNYRYKRTKSKTRTSEGDVRYYLRGRIFAFLHQRPSSLIARYILMRQSAVDNGGIVG